MTRGLLLLLSLWGATQAGPPASPAIIPLDQVSKSQAAVVSQHIANTEITITYSRPVARGRELFGQLVPYDEVWDPEIGRASCRERV